MDNNLDFKQKKMMLDELYVAKKISGIEWYESLCKLIKQFETKTNK